MNTINTATTIPSAHTLPRWACLALAAGCIAIGLWASVVTLQFFEHGAAALESDPALQALAKAAAVLFVFAEMSAFILAALIVGREFSARRMSLYAYAAVVLIVEVFTISAIQIATVVGADMTQASVAESVIDLRKQIAAAEAQAATYTANAASLRANDQLKKAAQQTDKATAAQDKAAALYAQLGTARDAKRPTLSAMLGETLAISYAIVRGLLVPATGLIFFGVAGALMLRRADGLSMEERILMALSRVEGAPAALPVATMPAAPVVPAVSFKPMATVAPAGAPVGVSYGSKVMLAGGGALAAMAAPVAAHAAPHAPAVPAAGASASAPEQTHLAETEPHQADASGASGKPGQSETEQAHSSATEQAHPVTAPAAKKRAWTATAVPDGDKLDSAVSGKGATRYSRVKTAVKAGKLKPSMRAIQAAEGGGGIVVRRYLQALEREGVIVKAGRGWVLASKTGGEA